MARIVGVDFPSCTWWSAGSLTPGVGDALVPRGGGILRTVRVKVGPQTGRMQVLVLRQRRHPNLGTAACCFFVAATPVFTPQPNGVTEIQTNIPVRNGYDSASGLENFDLLALSSLDPGVPVPSSIGGSGYEGGAIGGVFPHWEPGVEQRPDYGVVAFGQVLVAGDVVPVEEEEQEIRQPPPVRPEIALRGNGTLRTRGRTVSVPMQCTAAPCRGVVRLESRSARRGGRRASYGRASFALGAGATSSVQVRLSASARRTLRAQRRLAVNARLTLEGGSPKTVRIMLRAARG
jgi:hypothetical protein